MVGEVDLLTKLRDCPQSSDKIREYFSDVADLLMNEYVISKRGILYEIVEIEFYLFNQEHHDVITYPRNMKAGEWFFHQSGVDLTFESNRDQFGGILIRGIKRLTPRAEGDNRSLLILGPQKCVDELWDKFNAFKAIASEIPIIIPAKGRVEKATLATYQRWIPVKKGDDATAKIHKWIERINKADCNKSNMDISNEQINKISSLVFASKYRFLKKESIICEDSSWKKYASKPKTI